jgi:hypothetical protein
MQKSLCQDGIDRSDGKGAMPLMVPWYPVPIAFIKQRVMMLFYPRPIGIHAKIMGKARILGLFTHKNLINPVQYPCHAAYFMQIGQGISLL